MENTNHIGENSRAEYERKVIKHPINGRVIIKFPDAQTKLEFILYAAGKHRNGNGEGNGNGQAIYHGNGQSRYFCRDCANYPCFRTPCSSVLGFAVKYCPKNTERIGLLMMMAEKEALQSVGACFRAK